ncbi:hypothetical protein CFOL_v3_31494 [Cephalotus follicularis]|uniref:Uncharacterized protein n=1 Tax=Cephalotus follicularis TaxID=3775 RepID=A0A1Q3D6G3_CEPFO|nr:hypothetical protein CFOL_v3_31494 [Cephalotus follicularis]
MQKRVGKDHLMKNKRKWAKPGMVFPNKIGSVLSKFFAHNKGPEPCSSSGDKNGNDCGNDDHGLGYGKDIKIFRKDESYDMGSVPNTVQNSENKLNGEDQLLAIAPFHLYKKLLEIEDEEEKHGSHGDEKRQQQPSTAKKLLQEKSLSFFHKRSGLNFIRRKVKNANTGTATTSCKSNSNGGDSGSIGNGTNTLNDNATKAIVIGRRERCRGLPRVPSRILTTRKKLRMARSIKMWGSRRIEGEREDRGDKELCKKRILMGERCKPLNYSGSLHYDINGILLPEVAQDH